MPRLSSAVICSEQVSHIALIPIARHLVVWSDISERRGLTTTATCGERTGNAYVRIHISTAVSVVTGRQILWYVIINMDFTPWCAIKHDAYCKFVINTVAVVPTAPAAKRRPPTGTMLLEVDLRVTWVCLHDLTWHQNDLKVE